MYRKLFLYVKNIILNSFKNSSRFLLSVSGIFVGVVLLSYALFFLDGFYNGRMEEVEKMPENAFFVCNLDSETMEKLQTDTDLYSFSKEFSYTDSTTWLLHSSKYADRYFHFYSTVIGTPAQEKTTIYVGAEGPHLQNLSLIEGRFITNDDVSHKKRVVVIDYYAAELLYPGESAIGKKLVLHGDEIAHKYEIVGVCDAGYETKMSISYAKSQLASNIDSFFINSSIYIPKSVWDMDFSGFQSTSLLLWTELENTDKVKYENAVRNLFNVAYNENIIDKKSEEKEIESQVSVYKSLFGIFFAVVFIFSGLNCMNIVFFSVKERISEIGIRKAYGASKESIIIQFMLESLIVCFIATIFGVLVSLILIIKTVPLLESYLAINLIVRLKEELILLPLLAAISQGILFSIVPSIYASSIRIVDALRFE